MSIIQQHIDTNTYGVGTVATWPRGAAMVRLAAAVEATIQNPWTRIIFAGEALKAIDEIGNYNQVPSGWDYLIGRAEDARPTPCGSQELWGSAMQELESA